MKELPCETRSASNHYAAAQYIPLETIDSVQGLLPPVVEPKYMMQANKPSVLGVGVTSPVVQQRSRTQSGWAKRGSSHMQPPDALRLPSDTSQDYDECNKLAVRRSAIRSVSPATRPKLEDVSSAAQRRRINYQKGGGGGAFRRRLLGTAGGVAPDVYPPAQPLKAAPTANTTQIAGTEPEPKNNAAQTRPQESLRASEGRLERFRTVEAPSHSRNASDRRAEHNRSLNDRRGSDVVPGDSAWHKALNAGNFMVRKYAEDVKSWRKGKKSQGMAMNASSIEIKGREVAVGPEKPAPERKCVANAKKRKTTRMATAGREMIEMKKQILQELMAINNIPASYFLLGKEAAKCRLDIGIDDIVGLVDISTNEVGDIVIRPNEASISAQHSQGAVGHSTHLEAAPTSCKNAVTIRKMQVAPKVKMLRSPQRRLVTADDPARRGLPQRLSPLKVGERRDPQPARLSPIIQSRQRTGVGKGTVTSETAANASGGVKRGEKKVAKPISQISREKDDHLFKHPINTTIRLINEMLKLCASLRADTSSAKLQQFLTLAHKLGLSMTKRQISAPDYFKAKENIVAIKERLLRVLHAVVNKDNEFTPDPAKCSGYCKYYIGNGNNPMLVRTVLKQRWWWAAAESVESANLLWTQWKKAAFVESLPTLRPPVAAKEDLASTTTLSSDEGESHKALQQKQHVDSVVTAAGTGQKLISQPTEHAATGVRMCNHVEGNVHLGNKKAMYYNMRIYYEAMGKDPFEALPLTFHIKEGKADKEYAKFAETFALYEEVKHKKRGEVANVATLPQHTENVWIIKPGENSNRGMGIALAKSLAEIEKIISDAGTAKAKHTYIIQKYIERPLLINKRKFDIRCYGLVTAVNDHVKGYFYKEGYLRTASREFSLKNLGARIVHLTNEAVQKNYEEFGRFEPGNKLTYSELQKYIETTFPESGVNFYSELLPQIRRLVTDSMRATHGKLDPCARQQTFELFGYDFMIDADFHVFLIEANINPCLEIMSPVTARIVPAMVDSALRIAVDPIFPPPSDMASAKKSAASDLLPEIRHELVYDSRMDAAELQVLKKDAEEVIVEAEDEDNGGSDQDVVC